MGSVAKEGEGARQVRPVWEFFANAEFPFVDRLAQGEELSYPVERVSIM